MVRRNVKKGKVVMKEAKIGRGKMVRSNKREKQFAKQIPCKLPREKIKIITKQIKNL